MDQIWLCCSTLINRERESERVVGISVAGDEHDEVCSMEPTQWGCPATKQDSRSIDRICGCDEFTAALCSLARFVNAINRRWAKCDIFGIFILSSIYGNGEGNYLFKAELTRRTEPDAAFRVSTLVQKWIPGMNMDSGSLVESIWCLSECAEDLNLMRRRTAIRFGEIDH